MKPTYNENGSALIISIFVLLILTLIGISAMDLTNLEIKVSRNDKFTQMSHYAADGGGEGTKGLIELAVDRRLWMDTGTGTPAVIAVDKMIIPDNTDTPTGKPNKYFFLELVIDDETLGSVDDEIGEGKDSNIDLENRIDTYQSTDYVNAFIDGNDNYIQDAGETRVYVFTGNTTSAGGAIQMAAGYEGIGKGAAGAGAYRVYQVRSRQEGVDNAVGMVLSQWLHVY